MPTQVRGVYADIHTWENLYTAYLRAAHGKRSQEAVARFERRLEDNLIALQDELAQRGHLVGWGHFAHHRGHIGINLFDALGRGPLLSFGIQQQVRHGGRRP